MATASTKPTPDTLSRDDLTETFPGEHELQLHGVELTFGHERAGDGQITHLWVDPDLRGEGWGTAIINLVEEMIRDEAPDSDSYYLNIQIQNPGGVDEFLEEMGFVIGDERETEQFDNPLIEAYKRFE